MNSLSDSDTIVENASGKSWYKNGSLHREDGPAVESANGDRHWYQKSSLHRAGDQPAIEFANGDKWWYKNSTMHRDGDLPTAECANGDQYWIKDKMLHRDGDMPAVDRRSSGGDLQWYRNGLLHRDGMRPAVTSMIHTQYYKYGKLVLRSQIELAHTTLARFARRVLHRSRMRALRSRRLVCDELVCLPPRGGTYRGGEAYLCAASRYSTS
jgi:hypothetical protein